MSNATKFLASLAIAVASIVPTTAPAADYGYFIVSDYTSTADVLEGPFRSYDRCQFVLIRNNYKEPAHCAVKSW